MDIQCVSEISVNIARSVCHEKLKLEGNTAIKHHELPLCVYISSNKGNSLLFKLILFETREKILLCAQ